MFQGKLTQLCISVSAFVPTVSDAPIHLGRAPLDECAGVELTCQECDPFPASRFVATEDTTFVAVIGPAANPRGYTALTSKFTSPMGQKNQCDT